MNTPDREFMIEVARKKLEKYRRSRTTTTDHELASSPSRSVSSNELSRSKSVSPEPLINDNVHDEASHDQIKSETPEPRNIPATSTTIQSIIPTHSTVNIANRMEELEIMVNRLTEQNLDLKAQLGIYSKQSASSKIPDPEMTVEETKLRDASLMKLCQERDESWQRAQSLAMNVDNLSEQLNSAQSHIEHLQQERHDMSSILKQCLDTLAGPDADPIPEADYQSPINSLNQIVSLAYESQRVMEAQHAKIVSLVAENKRLKSQRQTKSILTESLSRAIVSVTSGTPKSDPPSASSTTITEKEVPKNHTLDQEMARLIQQNVQLRALNDTLSSRLDRQFQINADMKQLIVKASLGQLKMAPPPANSTPLWGRFSSSSSSHKESENNLLEMYNTALMEMARLQEELDILKAAVH